MPHVPLVHYDAELDHRVSHDIVRFRFRRSVFAALSIVIVFGELFFGVAVLVSAISQPESMQALVFSALSAFVITIDVSLGIRERASAHNATLNQLIGIRNQMRYPETSVLWQEYGQVKSYSQINYIESLFDCCSYTVPVDTDAT